MGGFFVSVRAMTHSYDVIILGAGAAGLFAGIECARRGRRTLVIDHSKKPAEKIRISGGGRCNFTNLNTSPDRFISANPHFAKSALARFTPWDFMDRMAAANLTWHEKTLGQLFCDQKSGAVIDMLVGDYKLAGGILHLDRSINGVRQMADGLCVDTGGETLTANSIIVATGGLSIPKIGATGLAYDIARHFGHGLEERRAGLVPFIFTDGDKAAFAALSGVSHPVSIRAGKTSFNEALLFTHRGLSGPAILQISSYWREGEAIAIDLLSATGLDALPTVQAAQGRQTLSQVLGGVMPDRLCQHLVDRFALAATRPLAELSQKNLSKADQQLRHWSVKPAGTEGWRTAEVTLGGVSTADLSSKTMESRHVPGLYFIGECVDVTGWLGGYNFQWAWASAWVAGQSA